MTRRLLPDPARPGSWLLRIDDTDQSYVDLTDPTRLEFEYVQRIADVIDLLAPPGARLRVVHVGGGAMTLARYVAETRPHSAQVVLEPDAELTAEVRAVVPLPIRSGIKVRPVDGRTGVAALPDDHADLLIVDAFRGSRVPADLTTREMFADVARVLGPAGAVVLNVTDHAPFPYVRRVLAGLVEVRPEVLLLAEPATLKGRRFGNLVLVAGVDLPVDGLTRRAAAAVFPYRILSTYEVSSLVRGYSPFHKQDFEESPEPPRGRHSMR